MTFLDAAARTVAVGSPAFTDCSQGPDLVRSAQCGPHSVQHLSEFSSNSPKVEHFLLSVPEFCWQSDTVGPEHNARDRGASWRFVLSTVRVRAVRWEGEGGGHGHRGKLLQANWVLYHATHP